MGGRNVDDAGRIRERLTDPALREALARKQGRYLLEVGLCHSRREVLRVGPRSRADR